MENILTILDKMIPEGIETFKMRYILLQTILEFQPVGRRALVQETTYSERFIRSTVEVFHQSGLIEIKPQGMFVTAEGSSYIETLYESFQKFNDFPKLEKKIKELLGLKKAIVVEGNSDEKDFTKWNLAKSAGRLMESMLKKDSIVAVTGGTTVSKMVESLGSIHKTYNDVTIVPARGSLGERVEFQASTISMALAQKLGAQYELLNIPDNLSQSTIQTIKKEPHIEKTLQKMAKSDIIVFGIGQAQKMAIRRKESKGVLRLLEEQKAVAEAFRYYFNAQGEIIHKGNNIGLDLSIVRNIPVKIAVAGGTSKAEALLAIKPLLQNSYLVLDEAAAKELLNKVSIPS